MALSRLQELREEMLKCFRCNLCKMVPLPVVRNPDFFDGCPAVREYGFHSYSGSGKQIMALSLTEGRIEPDSKLAEIVYACTTCGLCDVSCKFNMDAERHQVNMALREHMVDAGLGLPLHEQMIENLRRCGYPDGDPQLVSGRWAQGLGLKKLPEERAEVLLFAGCLERVDPGSAAAARKLARLLLHAGVDVGTLGIEEPCCGLPAYWTGYRHEFSRIASDVVSRVDRLGVRTVVVVSGSCLGSFRSKIPEVARTPDTEVVHATEFLWRLIQEKKLRLPCSVSGRVTYHDPCYLGRQSEPPVVWEGETRVARGCMDYHVPDKPVNRGTHGVYDAPRKILRAIEGLEFVEMYRIREYSFCCGGGGGVPYAYPGLAGAAARHRLEEARAVGAEHLVTACHRCRMTLANARDTAVGSGPPLLDIVDLVYQAAAVPL
jgi:heterodisulfide reductase subunit D